MYMDGVVSWNIRLQPALPLVKSPTHSTTKDVPHWPPWGRRLQHELYLKIGTTTHFFAILAYK